MSEDRTLNQCDALPPEAVPNLDPPPPYCPNEDDGSPSFRRIATDPELAWLTDDTNAKTGLGAFNDCDPMLSGKIVNDTGRTDISYQYSKALRGCDEAMMDMFSNVVVV